MRKSGILLHISSLPTNYGIGSFGKSSFAFVDFLERAKVKLWQVLPIGSTGYGDSPYQSFSTFAGNPYFIDLDILVRQGIMDEKDLPIENGEQSIDYGKLYYERYKTLKKAFDKSYSKLKDKVEAFCESEKWVEDYALFMSIKECEGGKSWQEWSVPLKTREEKAIELAKSELSQNIKFHEFLQYLFFEQWQTLKKYANSRGVEIFGDMPIYVSLDSSDVWANPKNFQLDEELSPTFVAGVPPDYFSEDGQLWGNPLFDWDYLKKTKYHWWVERARAAAKLFDYIRLDHFIGFANYFSIESGRADARQGEWKEGVGKELFDQILSEVEGIKIVAEDLGAVSEKVTKLRTDCGFPGMNVLQFMFEDEGYKILDEKLEKNSILYTGTHDNGTLLGWLNKLEERKREALLKELKAESMEEGVHAIIEICFASEAFAAIVPLQDFLTLDDEARMNTPGTLGENWKWRVDSKMLDEKLCERILALVQKYNR